jgi:uncharacterized membrane protein
MFFQHIIEIDAPASTIWPIMMDLEAWHEWTPSIKRIQKLDEGPPKPGSRAIVHQPKMPKLEWTVTEVDPLVNFSWETRMPGSRSLAHHRIESLGEGQRSKVTLEIYQEGKLARLMGPLFSPMVRRYIKMEAEGLKARAEAAAAGS